MSNGTPIEDSLVFAELLKAVVAKAPGYVPSQTTVELGMVTMNTGDYLYVGVEDPFATGRAPAARAEQEWTNVTSRTRGDEGSITCVALSVDAGGDPVLVLDQVVAIVTGVQRMLRDDVRMGIDGVLWTSLGTLDFDQDQTDMGAIALLSFRITYKAQLVRSSS